MAHRDFLEAVRAEKSDVTLQALCDRLLRERGVKSDTSMMSRFSFAVSASRLKKDALSRASRTARTISRHRARWRAYQGLIDSRRLVFIDETWTKTNMTRSARLGAWRPGQRLVDKVPHGRWKTATFLAALRNDRIDVRPACSTGPSTANASAPYVEQVPRSDPSSRATSSSSTTSAPTRQRPYDERSSGDVGARLRVSAQILPGPQSDRASNLFAKFKTLLRKARSPNIRRCRRRKRSHPRSIPARRMRRLCEKRRIRVKPNADRSRVRLVSPARRRAWAESGSNQTR